MSIFMNFKAYKIKGLFLSSQRLRVKVNVIILFFIIH